MQLYEVREIIEETKALLVDMVQDGIITEDEARELGPVILMKVLDGEYIER